MTHLINKLGLLLVALFLCVGCGWAQSEDAKNLEVNLNGKFYTIQYKIHPHKGSRGRKLIKQEFITFHIETRTETDSVLKSTFNGMPVIREITEDDPRLAEKGFMESMLLQLHVGDSATFWVNSDMQFEAINRRRPPFLKPGAKIKYIIKVLKQQNEEEVKKDEQDRFFQLKKVDEKAIIQYTTKSGKPFKKTYSGIWYHIDPQGDGDFALKDDVVSIRYVGKFLDGKVFSSSDQDGRNFEFPVGQKFAIQAFDELMLLMKKGGKGTFVVPSYLAYGAEGWGKTIPPYTPLVFEIEFMDIVSRKIIIENKGKILEEERAKKPKKPSEDEVQKQIEKDVKKKGLNIKN
jgi:FKBP-type peptidyl-prolyl cis-trans isomerase